MGTSINNGGNFKYNNNFQASQRKKPQPEVKMEEANATLTGSISSTPSTASTADTASTTITNKTSEALETTARYNMAAVRMNNNQNEEQVEQKTIANVENAATTKEVKAESNENQPNTNVYNQEDNQQLKFKDLSEEDVAKLNKAGINEYDSENVFDAVAIQTNRFNDEFYLYKEISETTSNVEFNFGYGKEYKFDLIKTDDSSEKLSIGHTYGGLTFVGDGWQIVSVGEDPVSVVIKGNNNDFTGTSADDKIYVDGSNNNISAGKGNDTVEVFDGAVNHIQSGEGDDLFVGNADWLYKKADAETVINTNGGMYNFNVQRFDEIGGRNLVNALSAYSGIDLEDIKKLQVESFSGGEKIKFDSKGMAYEVINGQGATAIYNTWPRELKAYYVAVDGHVQEEIVYHSKAGWDKTT